MKMYEATPGRFIPEGETLASMYQGDAMLDQMVEICGIDFLLPRPAPDTWTTKSGEVIKIADMTDDHLTNTVRYLRRLYGSQLDEELEDLEESDTVPAFPALLAEAEKRGVETVKKIVRSGSSQGTPRQGRELTRFYDAGTEDGF